MGTQQKKLVPLSKPIFTKQETEAVAAVLESGWVSRGPCCETFEKQVADFLRVPYVVTVTNCTAALYLAFKALRLPIGSEVIIPDFTFPAAGLAALQAGLVPVFVDVDPDTFLVKASTIQQAITEKTSAIVPIHLFGTVCQMDEIMALAKEYFLYVIEDAACAFGAKYNGQYAGTFGHMGCFSLHARKGITTGEGGLLVTNSEEHGRRALKLANCGAMPTYGRTGNAVFDEAGFNYKMSDIQAAVGVVQLEKVNRFISERKDAAAKWFDFISKYCWGLLIPQASFLGSDHIYQAFVCRVEDQDAKKRLIDIFDSYGIETGIGTYSCNVQPVFEQYRRGNCPVSEWLMGHTIALPMFPGVFDLIERAWNYG